MPKLALQRRLASQVLRCGLGQVRFDPSSLADISGAITKQDIRALIEKGAITAKQPAARLAKRHRKQRAGHRQGAKGARGAAGKSVWVAKVRAQRGLLDRLRRYLNQSQFLAIKAKIKGGFFKSRAHLLLWAREQGMIK